MGRKLGNLETKWDGHRLGEWPGLRIAPILEGAPSKLCLGGFYFVGPRL